MYEMFSTELIVDLDADRHALLQEALKEADRVRCEALLAIRADEERVRSEGAFRRTAAEKEYREAALKALVSIAG